MVLQGKIETWNEAKGYGFIAPDSGGRDVFVHISAFESLARRPERGDRVRYVLGRDRRGRTRARRAAFLSESVAAPLPWCRAWLPWVLVLSIAVLLAWWIGGELALVLLAYSVFSAVAFGMYTLDKGAARRNGWRIPESSLHAVALFGGWPGALLAQRILRHKTRKPSFQWAFRFTVVVNCGAMAWLTASPESGQLIADVLRRLA